MLDFISVYKAQSLHLNKQNPRDISRLLKKKRTFSNYDLFAWQ